MNTIERDYLALLNDIIVHGHQRQDRTGVGTVAVFCRQLRCDLSKGFPLLTTKRVAFKPIVGELLWFIEGSSDERRLCEITYGTRDPERKTIWSANAEGTTGAKYQPSFSGDLGRVYGVQWRHWQTFLRQNTDIATNDATFLGEIDQLAALVHKLKTNPTDRRMLLTALNVGEMDQMMIPPCHCLFQAYVSDDKLSGMIYIRSSDAFLGLPFNIASYALLIHMLAQVTNLKPGELIVNTGDTHLYSNHLDQAREQMKRNPLKLPTIELNPEIKEIDKFTISDIKLLDYVSHDVIKAEMAA